MFGAIAQESRFTSIAKLRKVSSQIVRGHHVEYLHTPCILEIYVRKEEEAMNRSEYHVTSTLESLV